MTGGADKVVLSKRTVDAFTCPPGRKDALLFDGRLTGFAIRATAAGNKVFILQYKRDGKVRRLVLGEYGSITVEQARGLAEVQRGAVKAQRDPREDQLAAARARRASREAADRQAEADAFTFAAMTQQWHDEHLVPNRSPAHAAEAMRSFSRSLPDWQARPAASIESAEASERFQRIATTKPAAALHTFRYAHAAFAWAVKRQLVPANPLRTAVTPNKPKHRDRALTDAELGAVWRACGALGHPFAALFRTMILTLQRRGEVSGMLWDELAPTLETWTMPGARTKNSARHVVHLAPAARAIIGVQPRFADCLQVFSAAGSGPATGFSKAKRRLDELVEADRKKAKIRPAKLAAWHLHDLRRTGATAMAAMGILPDVADRILNHQASSTSSGVKAVYQVHSFGAERAEAMERWADHVLAVAGVDPPAPDGLAETKPTAGNVVQLATRRRSRGKES
ncbi:tyrosine-type recombinase/integrase [Humitalea sp. 24SJ18S-53]|uniref:tyrosine-type recombinase/integrase n=1 Tax=Humitalea sp. 24SJ18S-53 TaxID=3422307 RepID=UPI003D66D4B4